MPQDVNGAGVPRKVGTGIERRRAIMGASATMMARDGFERTTMKAIARACEMTDAGLYYYFPSKRSILDAIWDNAIARANVDEPSWNGLQPGDANALIDELLDEAMAGADFRVLAVRQILAGDPRANEIRALARQHWRAPWLQCLDGFVEEERLALCAETAALIMLGILLPLDFVKGVSFAEAIGSEDAFRAHVKAMVAVALPPGLLTSGASA